MAFDDEWRGEANDGVVGFLAEHAEVHEALAEGPRGAGLRLQLDADERPHAADVFHQRRVHLAEARAEIGALG